MLHDVKVTTGLVVSGYRERVRRDLGRRVSQDEFSEMLCEGVRDEKFSRSTIAMWESDGAEPETDFLLDLLVFYQDRQDDWRFGFAADSLQAKHPEFFELVKG